MIINRRCSPYPAYNGDTTNGKRFVRIMIDTNSTLLPDYTNWSIINTENDSTVAVFNRISFINADLGWFMPGEGRLYKMSPTFKTGGTLVGDEYVNSSTTIKRNIYNNGYNITFGPNANVSFEDSAGIYMNGGVLKIGNASQTYGTNLQIKGVSSNKKWQGLVLEECDTVLIYGATFSNILSGQPAINLTNCFHFKIMNSLFSCGSNENSGGIYANYSESPEGDGDSIYQYIGYNTFSFNESSINVIQVVSTASPEIPLIIEGNQFNTGAGSVSSSGIFLSNITGGAIKHNEITNYKNGIILVSSSCDFFENIITSIRENTIAIQLKLGDGDTGPSNGYFTGGYNVITTLGSSSMNIDVANSYFNIDEGYNVFDIDFSISQRHITGYFPSSSELEYRAGYNCFKNSSSEDTASIFVTQGYEGDRISFNTSTTYCGSREFSGFEIFSLAGGINDTIFKKSGGEGGGYKDGQAMAIETQTSYKVLKDSININIRKRNYNLAELECKQMLLLYPDSSVSISVISKLYLSSLSLDSAGNHIQTTKTFYENLILNNPNNTPLIKRANYFIQKCKVTLKQYASALQGFQEIINQNPYSYEGLIASWDYAATTLLMGSGGENNDELRIMNDELKDKSEESFDDLYTMLDSLRNKKTVINSYTTEIYDTKKFTKQDREVINTNVTNAFKNERTKQIDKLKELEKKITSLSNSTSISKSETKINDSKIIEAKKELKTMKTLGEVVKVRKPKDLKEHIKIVNADIKKVFGTDIVKGNSKTNILIPVEYSLSQNYPNPFNPVTKINYELPKDGKVKLVIYDILGREIKTLVNELKQAGRYT
ncbi:MAG: hypothetical protein NTU73_07070, partial [Ignavibacteriae bacterium]|nr:hypothetical protein [Ignavibacteriota bacterium]